MKTSQEVYMDFRAAKDVVNELRQIAREVRRTSSTDLRLALSRVRSNWRGNNADAFLDKGTKLQKNIEETANYLDSLVNDIQQIADNTYRAEMEAIKKAQER